MDKLYDRVCIVLIGFGGAALMKYGIYTMIVSGA